MGTGYSEQCTDKIKFEKIWFELQKVWTYDLPFGIGPSVLAADMSRLAEECASLEKNFLDHDYIHLDIMDGHFVPNLTFGAPIIKCLRKHTKATLDAHLMVAQPELWVNDMADAGVDRFTFHLEATSDPQSIIDAVKSRGMKVGIALKPDTPIDNLLPFCEELDLVLIMTVEPGFGGQSFMCNQLEKVSILRKQFPHLNIEVDGGLNADTIGDAVKAGANLIVAGSFVFKGDIAHNMSLLRSEAKLFLQ